MRHGTAIVGVGLATLAALMAAALGVDVEFRQHMWVLFFVLASSTIVLMRTTSLARPAPADPSAKGWLQRGDVGASVAELQGLLNGAGFTVAIDKSFGPATQQAVKAYQDSRGLVNDGLAGPATMAALRSGKGPKHVPPAGPVLSRGSRGDEVARLQTHLRTHYPLYAKRLVSDGSFGPATDAAVREFQRRAGLVADGSVGPLTRAALGL